ncbi:oligosaccharide flippase family protein [Serratia sp. UGAL515B_01]|uniref:oligosaccharide flippase family protein n=1 Tax=Serratia sp. UGAL515B_01 TaxID=2986763 RepID=UPI002954C353|nr:oligosaccharide flippase family protein [Serratia sp. UGAL515B_01]WON76294.1 oligosaccharide flippase family protein [Serratia sp. UGAL515B_01]
MFKSMSSVVAQSLIKITLSILSLKFVAYYMGPAGMMMYGQIQSFAQIAGATTSSVTSSGVVKFIAEKEHPRKEIISTALLLLFIYSIIIFIFFALGVNFAEGNIISKEWITIYMMTPLGALFIGGTNLVVSILNGEQDFKGYFVFSITNSFALSLLTIILCYFLYQTGAMLSIVLSPLGAFFFSAIWVKKIRHMFVFSFSTLKNNKLIASLLQYSFMAIISAVVVYGTQIYIRNLISINVSMASAGIWFSATKLSEVYMGIVSVLFSSILIPRYTIKKGNALKEDIKLFFYIAMFLGFGLIAGVYLLSPFIISIIYGAEFKDAEKIIFLYSFGDALKIITWVFLYVMISKQYVKIYLVYEIASSILYFLFCTYGLKLVGFELMAIGYPLQSFSSLILIILWYYFVFNKMAISNDSI